MKVVITGGAGFIGSHLCKWFINENHDVICVDNFITGDPKNLPSHKNLTVMEKDISTPFTDEQKNAIQDAQVIFNLASPASPLEYHKIPLQTLWTNAAGTKNLLDIAAKNNIKFIQASTSEIYGNPKEHPQKESYFGNVNPIGSRSCYNEGKRFAEALCVNYQEQYKFPLKIVRVFNVYGPNMAINDGRVVPEFIKRAIENEPLLLAGDGNQTRSFCYIDDMIDGLIKVMRTSDGFIGPVNLGNPREITVKQLADLIIKLTGSKSPTSQIQKDNDDPDRRCPDITLARGIGFEPKIDIETGLNRTIQFFKNKFVVK
jgi:UDP-glucuronate decarboxylase